MQPILVKTLGDFSLQSGDNLISDSGNRSRKVWGLLAYLVCHREQPVSQKKLIDLLWGEDPASSNPENALRITLHRVRTLLETLVPGDGRDFILYRDGGYIWNPAVPLSLDCHRFEELSRTRGEDRLERVLEALSLYGGEFLSRQSSEMWVIPVSTHFQNLYISLTLEAAQSLSDLGRHREAEGLCRRAVASEIYHEPLHCCLMRILAAMEEPKAAAEVYESLSKRLFDDFGIHPSQETREVYRACAHSPQDRKLPMEEVLEHLREKEVSPGAMECDYDYFKVLCFAQSRSLERSGSAAHIALLNISSGPEKSLTKRSLNRIMEQLGQQLRRNLRRGDVIARCSVCQYIIMLPMANYENSCMVCRRIISAFARSHPHVTAKIQYMVQPLTPGISVP